MSNYDDDLPDSIDGDEVDSTRRYDPVITTGDGGEEQPLVGQHLGISGGIATIGRRKYAVSLYWQPSPSGRISQAAREAANQPGQMADFFAVRPGNAAGRIPQFGLGQKELGHKIGMPTGAASLAEEQPGSWAGVFKVPEGWWLVVCRDDLIAPDGDALYDDEKFARDRLLEELALGGLQRIFAPANWQIPRAEDMPLSLIMQARADARLQYVRLPVKQLAIAAGILIAVVAAALFIFSSQQTSVDDGFANLTPEQQAEFRQQQMAKLAPPPPPPPPPRKWEDEPRAGDVLASCAQMLAQVPATVLGWEKDRVSCNARSLTVEWRRLDGPAIIPPNATLGGQQDKNISSVYDLPPLSPRGVEEIGTRDSLLQQIYLNNWNIKITGVEDDTPPQQTAGSLPGAAPSAMAPLPWVKKKITLKTDTTPWGVWQTYAIIPGLVVNNVIWGGGRGADWTVEGVVYEYRDNKIPAAAINAPTAP